jgi:hypothetical protein
MALKIRELYGAPIEYCRWHQPFPILQRSDNKKVNTNSAMTPDAKPEALAA